ncbi:MAG: hypothetical protein JJT77_06990 [Crocinitomicaceae bacterium]|nr:hypothetical protein [Crocinitomicaceae bacterium]
MTIEEAKIFFPYEEDFDDAWEQYFFEQKQFFIHRFPMASIIESRFKKIFKVQESYEIISNHKLPEPSDIALPIFIPENNVLSTFNALHKFRNECRQILWTCLHPQELHSILMHWAELEVVYANKWRVNANDEENKDIIVSKEPDPMYILTAIKSLESNAQLELFFTDLEKHYLILPEILKTEIKRLNLFLKRIKQ